MGDAKRTHGLTNSPTWTVWCAMIQRCKNPKTRGYASYGGRGIRVCRRWKKFENFLADMGERPEGYSLERRDVNGNYEPDNCIWIPMEDQHANKRNTVTITVDGVTKRLVEWAREKGVQPQMIEKRIYAGWPPDLAVMAPKGSTRASLRHRQSIDDAA